MNTNKDDARIERLSTLSSDIDNLINRNQQLEKQVNDLTLWFALDYIE